MADKYDTSVGTLTGPADRAAAVTPSDGADLAVASRAVYIGGAGNLKIDTVGGDTVTLQGCLAGTVLPVRARKIYATGTTATNLVALW